MTTENKEEVKKLLNDIHKELSAAIDKGIIECTKNNERNVYPSMLISEKTIDDKLPSITARSTREELFRNDSESQSCKDMKFLNITASQNIDENIKQMRVDLKKSYDLFTNTRDMLQSINFSNLKSRIKDLHLCPSDQEVGEIINNRPIKENVNKLTDLMAGKFGEHPGEFGDIPELTTFYRACSQLEHGMNALSNQQNNFNDLTKRIQWATNVSDARTNEIQKLLKAAEDAR